LAAVGAAVLLAACGTRLPDSAFVSTGDGAGRVGVGSGSGGGAGGSGAGSGDAGTGDAGTGAGGGSGATGGSATGGGAGVTVPGAGSGDGGAGGSGAGAGAAGGGGAAGPNQASDVGVGTDTITIGTIVAENGVLGDTFAPAATGLRAWVEYVNRELGGIGGRRVVLETCDDREDRARTLECARTLVEDEHVFALIATNTRALGGAATYLHEQGVPVLGNPINNSFYRFDNFFSVYGSPYARDNQQVAAGGNLVSLTTVPRWFATQLHATSAAVFSYDVPESAQAGAFIEEGLREEGLTVDRYVVSFAAPSFDAAVAEMQRKGTQLIFDAMDEGANRRLCDAMARRQFTVLAKVSTIPLMGDSLGQNFNDACRPVTYVAGDSLPYTDTSVPFIAAYRASMARYQPAAELHQWGLEAWVMAQMLQDYLTAAGPAPTRAGFVQHLNSLQAASPAGVMTPTIQYTPGDFSAPAVHDCIAVARWDDAAGGWVSATPFPYCIDDARQFQSPVSEDGT
jgi:branched-chain amino acid transport system substrate-binding protein